MGSNTSGKPFERKTPKHTGHVDDGFWQEDRPAENGNKGPVDSIIFKPFKLEVEDLHRAVQVRSNTDKETNNEKNKKDSKTG